MYCPNCGKDLPDDAVFCGYCGATLEGQSHEAAEPEEPAQAQVSKNQKNKRGGRVLKVLGYIAAIIVLWVILFVQPAIVPRLLGQIDSGDTPRQGEVSKGTQSQPDDNDVSQPPQVEAQPSGAVDGLALSTEERPAIEDFDWYLEGVEQNGVPDNIIVESEFDNLAGGWKCLFIYDPEGVDTGRFYDFLNLTLSGAEGNGRVILDWSHMHAGDQRIDETGMEDTVLNMNWDNGSLYGYGAMNLSVDLFYSYQGAQYAVGTLTLSDGGDGLVAMIRP